MFTGIVEETGTIREIKHGQASSRLVIGAAKVLEEMKTGDSVSVNGICLTVTGFTGYDFSVDVMPETLRQTSLGDLSKGSPVNLERALRLSDRLGGHLVSGHIDGTGRITRQWREDNAIWLEISTDAGILKYMIDRGSVSLDGVSLTVTMVGSSHFRVSVIPHTQQETILTGKRVGGRVNIECDLVAKYIERLAGNFSPGKRIDIDFLERNGFA